MPLRLLQMLAPYQMADSAMAAVKAGYFSCRLCEKIFNAPLALKDHLVNSHGEERPFSCPWYNCSSAFKQITHLKQHIRRHTGEKPYACPLCSYKATLKGNINKHLKNVHKENTAHVT